MAANEFITKLKADGSETDPCDLESAFREYSTIASNLAAGDRAAVSLNVLCVICRNIEKVPSYRTKIDPTHLLNLSIQCVRETRTLEKEDRVKILACLFHLHKFVVRENPGVQPQLLLKLSYMAFERDLIPEYAKTYWNIIADRLTFLEKLKSKMPIIKLLPKLAEDICNVIKIYDTVPFCAQVLPFLMKKLYCLYSELNASDLNKVFGQIFETLSTKNDLKTFKKMPDKDALDVYCKLCECLYVVAENSSKIHFKETILTIAVRTLILFLGHCADILHCLQILFLNSFCCILGENQDISFIENILDSLKIHCETAEKLGYVRVMLRTYPYINQLLKVFIEYYVTNQDKLKWEINFNIKIQESCFKTIVYLVKALKNCEQMTKCENCPTKTGLHDALRSAFLCRKIISISITHNLNITNILPIYHQIAIEQYQILQELLLNKCSSYDKYYRNYQADIHNTAISLNQAEYFECSIKLFNLYIQHEITHFKNEIELKNISRALYNKGICELNSKQHVKALKSAYLSLIFAQPEGLNTEKYMSLVIDIKAKALKIYSDSKNDNENDNLNDGIVKSPQNYTNSRNVSKISGNDTKIHGNDTKIHGNDTKIHGNDTTRTGKDAFTSENSSQNDSESKDEDESILEDDDIQMMTVLDVCVMTAKCNDYGNLKPFFCKLEFSTLLKHEFSLYARLWPSLMPTVGVVRTLHQLFKGRELRWLKKLDGNLKQTLYEILIQLPTVVRSISTEYLSDVINEIVEDFELRPAQSVEEKVFQATLFLLKAEFDLSDAAQKFGWKIKEPNPDPDLAEAPRTIKQEHEASKYLIKAVDIWTDIIATSLPQTNSVQHALKIAQVFVAHLLHMNLNVHALQLAHICCQIAKEFGDKESYIHNAGIIFSHTSELPVELQRQAFEYYVELDSPEYIDITARLSCDFAIHSIAKGDTSFATALVLETQERLLNAKLKYPHVNLDLSLGRLMQVQSLLLPSDLTNAINAQRHYLLLSNKGTTWTSRRLRSLTLKHEISSTGLSSTSLGRDLLTWRRARSAAAQALPAAAAVTQALIFAGIINTHLTDDAKKKIDHRLKHILGVQPSSHQILSPSAKNTPIFTPKQDFEMMLENFASKPITSPIKLPVPGFVTPEFLKHDKTCTCYLCVNPYSVILIIQAMGLEASTYFRGNEYEIAKNYYNGCLKSFFFAEQKLKQIEEVFNKKYERYIIENVKNQLMNDFNKVIVEILIENAFFELTVQDFISAHENIVRISELLVQIPQNEYLRNDFNNLIIATIKMQEMHTTPRELGLDVELEGMRLSPAENIPPPKTPEVKAKKPPKITKNIVKDEELPKTRRRVIEFKLDDDTEEKPSTSGAVKKSQFKIPVPVTNKPVPESVTPRNTRSIPKILLTQPSEDRSETATETGTSKTDTSFIFDFATPKPLTRHDKTEFFTPAETSSEQFFTPMTSVKTYSKKSLRKNIVKNLESEFSTPVSQKPKTIKTIAEKDTTDLKPECLDKENMKTPNVDLVKSRSNVETSRSKVETGSLRRLKRATSPGKLGDASVSTGSNTRSRVRPLKFNDK